MSRCDWSECKSFKKRLYGQKAYKGEVYEFKELNQHKYTNNSLIDGCCVLLLRFFSLEIVMEHLTRDLEIELPN
jgi:hypothetical protein